MGKGQSLHGMSAPPCFRFALVCLFLLPLGYGAPGPGIRSEPQSGPKLQLQLRQILDPLCGAGDWTCVPELPQGGQFCCATADTPSENCFEKNFR